MKSRNAGRCRWDSPCSAGGTNAGRSSGFLIGIVLLLVVAKGIKDWDTKPRVVSVPDNFTPMEEAIAKAQGSLDEFIKQLKNPRPTQSGFAVKGRFAHPTGNEVMWVMDVQFDGKECFGTLGNAPSSVTEFRMGDTVTVPKSNVCDWAYTEYGELIGAFTQSAMLEKLEAE